MKNTNTNKSSIVRRASFDIGSVTTKMVVADIDKDTKTIIVVVLRSVRQAGYKNNLERLNHNGSFSLDMISQGIQVLQALKTESLALSPEPTEFRAVATAAFRTANNGLEVANIIEKKVGIPVKIIDQEEEARLGFQGAITKTNVDVHHALVWDVGGGSMQITAMKPDNQLQIYESKQAFVPFAKTIIKDIQHKDPMTHASPNPLEKSQALEAVTIAQTYAEQLPDFIKQKIQRSDTVIIGIGAIYYATNPTNTPILSTFKQADINQMLLSKLNKADSQLLTTTNNGLPVFISATSLAFILGFMKTLNIRSITVTEINMNDGMLTDPCYYPEKV